MKLTEVTAEVPTPGHAPDPQPKAEAAQQQTSIICIPGKNKRARFLETASTHT